MVTGVDVDVLGAPVDSVVVLVCVVDCVDVEVPGPDVDSVVVLVWVGVGDDTDPPTTTNCVHK